MVGISDPYLKHKSVLSIEDVPGIVAVGGGRALGIPYQLDIEIRQVAHQRDRNAHGQCGILDIV